VSALGSSRAGPVAAAAGAALLWASYYPFVLAIPNADTVAVWALPPLFGGLTSTLLALFDGSGGSRAVARLLMRPSSAVLGVLFLAYQVNAILATRTVGSIDTSLVVLLSDILVTPLLLYAIYREGGRRLRYPVFWGGVALLGVGAALAIGGGAPPSTFGRDALAILLPLPLVTSFLVLRMDRGTRRAPLVPVLAAMMLLAFIVGAVGATALFGPGVVFPPWDPRTYTLFALYGVTNFSLAPILFFWSAQRISLVVPSVLQAATPIFALALVVLLGFTTAPALALLGVPLAVAGGIAAIVEPPRRPGRPTPELPPMPPI
jgi:drug/metabolite transporter (DMT)-like permease